jgi:hypothetical protein
MGDMADFINDDTPSEDEQFYLECPQCGNEAAEPDKDGMFYDGQPLTCGCEGHVSCDTESDPEVFIDERD